MEVKEYSQELQKLYLEFMMNDHELFVRVNNIVKPEYFDLIYFDFGKSP